MRSLDVPVEYQRGLLRAALSSFFGDLGEDALDRTVRALGWLEIDPGEVLFEEGAPGEEMFFLVSGRMRATVRSGSGDDVVVGTMGRGDAIGEFALITGEARSARVTAVRPSVLVKLSRAGFAALSAEHPAVSLRLAHRVIDRLRRAERRMLSFRDREVEGRPVSFALVPLSGGLDLANWAEDFAIRLRQWGRTLVLTHARVEEHFKAKGPCASVGGDREFDLSLTRWLDQAESMHDFVLYVGDEEASAWTRRCQAQADELLLVASGTNVGALSPLGRSFLSRGASGATAPVRLLILHDQAAITPVRTASLLSMRDVADHVHLRRNSVRDLDHLARIVSRNAVGLVLSGGAARGFAHLGVYRALVEAGFEIDYVGGTSMGAGVGSLVALDLSPDEAIDRFRSMFKSRPVSDFNILPLVSIIKGRRLEAQLHAVYARPDGSQPDIEDTWRSFFCVAASYSFAREAVLRRGPLARLVRASLSVPVFLPPVLHQGEVLVDGGVFNNFPVEEMAKSGVRGIIGVDLGLDPFGAVGCEEIPGVRALLSNRLRRRPDPSLRVPSIGGVLYHTPTLASRARQAQSGGMVDLLIRPDMAGIRSTDWSAMERAIERGYRAAQAEIERKSRTASDVLAVLRPAAPVSGSRQR